MSTTTTDNIVQITDMAQDELLKLEVNHENFLRLWVVEGGCKGYTYQAAIDNQFAEEDQVVFSNEKMRVVSDAESVLHFDGLQIDFSDDMTKGGFRFLNPTAKASCGCGSSFCS